MSDEKLQDLRGRIDAIDARLLKLISERADYAIRIGRLKRELEPGHAFYRPARESVHLRELIAANDGPLQDAELTALFREIISVCRALEQEITVAYLGPQGTFTQEAAFKHFGRAIATQDFPTVAEVFRAVESGKPAYGVVPVENSSEGVVTHTLDCFMDSALQIVGEIELPIRHCLLGAGAGLAGLATVYSHQQSFAQCRRWLDENLPGCKQVAVHSNAAAALKAHDEHNAAAIAGAGAAAEYGLHILAEGIEDYSCNATRFLVIGGHGVPPTGADKTSVLVSARNQPGSLAALLRILADRGVSLTRIESRPARIVNWEYVFFLDIEGHCEDEVLGRALAELDAGAGLYKLLGSYPCASA